MAHKTWILLACRANAKILEYRKKEGLRVIQEVLNPQGKLKNQDLKSDRQARTRSEGMGKIAGYSREVEPKEHVAISFAKQLNKALKKGFDEHAYESLVLIAEPRFLGHLKMDLKIESPNLQVRFLNKDLTHLNERELFEKLSREKIFD